MGRGIGTRGGSRRIGQRGHVVMVPLVVVVVVVGVIVGGGGEEMVRRFFGGSFGSGSHPS